MKELNLDNSVSYRCYNKLAEKEIAIAGIIRVNVKGIMHSVK